MKQGESNLSIKNNVSNTPPPARRKGPGAVRILAGALLAEPVWIEDKEGRRMICPEA